jgi:predicted AlkP superfamily pyrophosphatase or phosphodiesterase
MTQKLLLIILDGVPYRNWVRLFGNLEGWVQSGDAQRFKMSSVLPSTSASCYASIHTGVSPQVHEVTGNDRIFRLSQPDVFSQARKSGLITGAVTHSFGQSSLTAHHLILYAILNMTNQKAIASITAVFIQWRDMVTPTK